MVITEKHYHDNGFLIISDNHVGLFFVAGVVCVNLICFYDNNYMGKDIQITFQTII